MPRHEEKLTQLAALEKVDLLMIGDSITHSWENTGKQTWQQYYGKRKALNLGFSGDRTEHVLWRLDHGELDGCKPKVVVLMIGTNNTGHRKDPPQAIAAGVKKILERIEAKSPQTKVLLLAIFPRAADKNDPQRMNNDKTNTLLAMQESLTTQIAGLDQRVEACQAGMEGQASTEADLRDEIVELQAELVARDATIARLEQDAAAASAAEGHDDSRVTALLAMAEKRAADLERTTTALNAALSRKAALEGEARQAEAARVALQADLAAAEAAARQASDDSAVEIARLQSLLDQALSQAEAAQTDFAAVGEMAGDLAAAQAEIERLEGALEADAGTGAMPSTAEATPAATALNQGLQAWSAVASQARPEVEGLALPGDSLVLSGSESIFLTGSAEISETGQVLLDELAAEILSIMETLPVDADWRLEVQGHADIRPTGARWPSNWELSAYRASAAVRALAEAGAPVERLAAVGLGEYHPLVDEATQEAYAMNRRLELRFR